MRTCALFLVALAASAQGVNFYSLEQEAALGAKMAASMVKQITPTAHPQVREYVQRLVQKIKVDTPLDASGRHFQDYKVSVVVENAQYTHGTHEPVVLPGGYIFVPESLILAAQNEAEFAGMLAHAMAHVNGRHATRLLTRNELANTANSSPDGRIISYAMLMFQREFEAEADVSAVQLAAAAGFDPAALARYIDRTQVDEGPKAFSSMPLRSARVEKIDRAIAVLPARAHSQSDEFLAIQKQLQ
jgi:predicted Zn-dependent protease